MENVKINFALKAIVFLILYYNPTISPAQHNVFSVNSSKLLTITAGTIFSADSLVLVPSNDFTMGANAVLETPFPVSGYPTGSINRVYYLDSPVVFTGDMFIYYQPAELNGNNESMLQFADSTVGSWWLFSASSTVNTVNHSVKQVASGLSMIAATASQVGNVLALQLLSFAGSWQEDHTQLIWVVSRNENAKSFTIESSTDQQGWQITAKIQGSAVTGQCNYFFNDKDVAFTTRLYRIKITDQDGGISYSPLIKINKGIPLNSVFVVGKSNGAIINFVGLQPKGVRVMNAVGQVIWTNNTSSNHYELNNILPGIYFLQYELNGQTGVKKFALR